jgi:DNA-binding transcriptional ArsR family regulator
LRGAEATAEAQALDAIFGALSDPIRRGIVARLTEGSCSVTRLGEPFAVSAPAISRHLTVLQACGLIERWKEGRVHYCRLLAAPLRQAGDWVERHRTFWEERLDALAEYLDDGRDAGCPPPDMNKTPQPSCSDAGFAPRANASSRPGRSRKR